jgi:hypothetical protein
MTAFGTSTYLSANSAQYIRAIDLKALLSPALSILPASQFRGLEEIINGVCALQKMAAKSYLSAELWHNTELWLPVSSWFS